jgi:long-chain acyl-CoA synthetase
MQHIEGTFKGFGNCQLYFQSWHPDNPSQAIVVLVHGLGGHSGLFTNVIDYLVPQGYEVYALDLRGHGRSPGQRGHINAWGEFREDLQAFINQIRAQRSRCPIILWGHSLGGTIALDYALRSPEQLQGLIVTAPALGKTSVPAYKLMIGKGLSKLLPRFSLKLGLGNNWASRDPIALAHYQQDPLRHEYGSARLATEFMATVDWIAEHTRDLKIPLLILHGSGDRITSPQGSRAFFQHVLYADKEHREYAGSYHELYIDLDFQRMFNDVEIWLDRHLVGAERCQPFTACTITPQTPLSAVCAGMTLPALLDAACDRPTSANANAFNEWTETGWQTLSNQDFRARVNAVALGLLNLGLVEGDRVAFLMHSDVNFAIADLGCLLAHLVDVPIDLTQTLENIIFVLQHSQAKLLIVADLDLLVQVAPYLAEAADLQQIVVAQVPANWQQLRSQVFPGPTHPPMAPENDLTGLTLNLSAHRSPQKTQICFPKPMPICSLLELETQAKTQITAQTQDASLQLATLQLAALRTSLQPESLATLIYIPAESGQLEGVMLSHGNLAGNALSTFDQIPDLGWGATEVVLAFLPLTHVFARTLLYGHIYYGHCIYFSDPNRLLRHLQSVQPTVLATVPLLLEKTYGQILDRGRKLKSGWQRLLFNWAVGLAKHYQLGTPPGRFYAFWLQLADRLVFRRWRSLFGGRLKYLLSGGAALKPELANIFAAAGLPILQGYGLTQAGGVVCFNRPGNNRADSVGTPIPGMEVAIAADGEILLRGAYVSSGYYQNPISTQVAIAPGGWWRTGDLGHLTLEGRLGVTGLKKSLFKLSTGKYIAPQPLEARLQQSSLVAQVRVVGADRKFCAALIFPDLAQLRQRAGEMGLRLDTQALLKHPCILEWYQALVDAANCHLPYWAIVKRFRLINPELMADALGSAAGQTLPERQQISQKFAPEIAALYGDADPQMQMLPPRSPQLTMEKPDLTDFNDLNGITCPMPPMPACPVSAQSLKLRFTS